MSSGAGQCREGVFRIFRLRAGHSSGNTRVRPAAADSSTQGRLGDTRSSSRSNRSPYRSPNLDCGRAGLIGISAHSATHAAQAGCGPQLFHSDKDGTRIPEKHEYPGQSPWRVLGEDTCHLLAHRTSPLTWGFVTVALTSPVRAARPRTNHPWSLRERLDEREIAEPITAYRDGATAASLATIHGVSIRSVKRLLHSADVRHASLAPLMPRA